MQVPTNPGKMKKRVYTGKDNMFSLYHFPKQAMYLFPSYTRISKNINIKNSIYRNGVD
jgi:hypothetical protein